MWVKGVLSPERLPEPLQRATLVIESAALCLAFCVRVSRERRYGLPDNWHSYGCQGDPWDVNYGYDAQKGEFTDVVQAGIIDPTRVVRHALQDAASIAGLLITTEATVAEKPESKSAMPAMPPGGGMGGMDF